MTTSQISGYTSDGKPIYTNVIDTTATVPTPYQSAGSYTNPQLQGGISAPPTIPVINSTNSSTQNAITVPPPTINTTNHTGIVSGGQATIDSYNKVLTPTETTTPDFIKQMQDLIGPRPSAGDISAADYSASGIAGFQNTANIDQQAVLSAKAKLDAVNAKLAGINAEATAASLKQEGRQAPMFAIGGTQAQIERERAIRVLPIQAEALVAQAEVAAAQGNAQLSQSILQQAQDHLDKVYQIHMTDAQNTYNRRVDLITKAMDYADKKLQQQLADQKATLASNNTQFNAFINDVRNAATSATSNLQGSLATKITNLLSTLDPNSKTFLADFQKVNAQLATLQGQIVPKATVTKTATTPATPTTFTTTQAHNGAANAGLTQTVFDTLNPDVKNYFVNTSPTAINAIQAEFSAIQDGSKKVADVKTLIDSSNLSQPVKDYWTSKLPAETTSGSNFLGDIWDGIKSWFSNL